jgi:hypothetical protein
MLSCPSHSILSAREAILVFVAMVMGEGGVCMDLLLTVASVLNKIKIVTVMQNFEVGNSILSN